MTKCGVCGEQRQTLVSEWRGIEFVKPLCTICANKVAVETIRKEAKQHGTV